MTGQEKAMLADRAEACAEAICLQFGLGDNRISQIKRLLFREFVEIIEEINDSSSL